MAPPVPLVLPTNIPIQDVIPQQSLLFTTQTADSVNGNMFLNDGTSLLYVSNGATGNRSVTIWAVPDEAARTGTSAASLPLPNASIGYQVTMTAGQNRVFGPFRQAWWNQTSINVGYVYVAVNIQANVGLGIINY